MAIGARRSRRFISVLESREATLYSAAMKGNLSVTCSGCGSTPLWIVLLLLGLPTAALRAADSPPGKLSYADLVHRLTDLDYLATVPAPGEATAQFSSYDRASRYDTGTGKYVRWDANGDGDGIIRKEDGKLVLAEMQGPGCIRRMWSATPAQGHVRIYLDGAKEPAVDLPFLGYFDRQNAPFTRPALVHTVSHGWNNYTPIPYQKSCKIVADEGWGAYYHFDYSTFPKGTEVPTFTRELSADDNAALDEADRALSHCGPREFPDGHAVTRGEGMLAGHGGSTTAKLDGPGAVALVRVKLDLPPPPADRDVLRQVTLQIRWDGEKSASVWAPLGDFFGTAPGVNTYQSLPCGMAEDGWFYANWLMPFAKGAEIKFTNDSTNELKLRYEIWQTELKGDPSRYARFHAKWHRDEFLPTEIERQIDWPFLKVTGAGRYVGLMLHIWNARGGWWGEGDEKFFVDAEKFPSTFGTGSEDYFGYAWSSPDQFRHAFHNQTHNDGDNRGHISVNRFQIADQVPFHRQFEGCIEKYYPNQRGTLYASTVYWYLEPGGNDPYTIVPVEERLGYYVMPEARKVAGAIEAESLKVLATTGGAAREQNMAGFGDEWSNDLQLWWTGAKPGDKLDLALPVAKAGNYKLSAQFTKAVDYGIVQLWLDGHKLGQPIDLYHGWVIATGDVGFGVQRLSQGDHTLSVEITGANPKAEKSYMVGLDYLKLVDADRR
jgi:hypothetical protein